LSFKHLFTNYGVKVPGYDTLVVNEREARAAAGILFALGMMVIFIGIGYNHVIVARVYLAFLWIDFTARIINPQYSPSMLMGKFAVRNQKPEYVGAVQKRFAWSLGWLISLPMMYWFVLNWDITFYKVMVCVLCLTLMFLESAFSFCVGCAIYQAIVRKDPMHCPGGVCEVQKKEPIQTFNATQKAIALTSISALIVGVYLFLAYTESKTFFGEFLHEKVLTATQLQEEADAKYAAEEAAFEDEDF